MDDTGLVGPSVGEPHSSSILIDFRDEVEPVSAINVVDLGAGKLRELLKAESVVFVDARSMEEFELAHIKDAIHLARFDSSSIRLGLAGIAKDQAIIVYCSSINCPRGRAATGALMKAGFTHVTHYPPGWSELKSWEELSIYKHLGEQSH
jgi:rhodanese-related sulfurtransferase